MRESGGEEEDLARQVEVLKLDLQNKAARDRLMYNWERFIDIPEPRAPRREDAELQIAFNAMKSRKATLTKQMKAYREKGTIPRDLLNEGALKELLEDLEEKDVDKAKLEEVKTYNTELENILDQFNETVRTDFFGDIEVVKFNQPEYLELKYSNQRLAKFDLKANLNRPLEF